ncbi:NgoFVII family restriction endonuclease [Mycoplasma wenyonii]|uniref:NgoFVII family restriction endonuclease n=1 Tax=Mycoplasma wenyonii TaxID=65123 RepID=UPI0002F444FF|nr:NgoFVII family restriction endonuclease [Mycoplasma wenyonii]
MVSLEELEQLEQSEALRIIAIPLIVPAAQEIIDNADLDLSFSQLNACYSKPAINEKTGKRQSWHEVKLIIEGEDNLPSKKDWFYLVTDSGWLEKACFSGRGKRIKWLNTFKRETIIGNWIKNKLVEWEVIEEFWYPDEDKKKSGVVTKEALELYGGSRVYLRKPLRLIRTKKELIEMFDLSLFLSSFLMKLTNELINKNILLLNYFVRKPIILQLQIH